jgi:hypothetical protein
MSNFSCIGLGVYDQASYGEMVDRLIDLAADDGPRVDGSTHIRWKDRSGASVAFHMTGRSIDCVTPFFEAPLGPAAWRVRTTAATLDPGCIHCSGAECDLLDQSGALATRSAVQWLHFLPYREFLSKPQTFDLEVAAFCQAADFFPTPEAFRDGQRSYWARPDGSEPADKDGKPLRLAEISFMPSGMFGPPGGSVTQRALVTFSGHTERSERLTNTVTGRPFHWVRVRTLPGPVDAVFDPADVTTEPAVGSIAFLQALLVGRPRFS